jgi:hypothetical protein
MRIPKENLTHEFVAEILDLFQVNAKTSVSNFVLIKDNYHSTIHINKDEDFIEFISTLEVRDFGKIYLSFLEFIMKSHNRNFNVDLDDCTNKNGSNDLTFLFKYDLRNKSHIEDIEILNLHNLFESLLYKANHICREILLIKRVNELNAKEKELIKDINKLERIYRK